MNRRVFIFSGLAALAVPLGVLAEQAEDVATGSALTSGEVKEFLRLHNQARAEVGVGPLRWSAKIAEEAQNWANHLASTGKFEHQHSQYGENLAGNADVKQAVKSWVDERANYLAGADFSKTGHYTQVVWRDTKLVGCGKAKSADFTIFVAYYDPPGNMGDEKPY